MTATIWRRVEPVIGFVVACLVVVVCVAAAIVALVAAFWFITVVVGWFGLNDMTVLEIRTEQQ